MSAGKIDFRILDRPDIPVRKYTQGTTILQKGGVAREMFLLRKGLVDILLHDKVVEEVGPGGIFGEMALIDDGARMASATAVTETVLQLIPGNVVREKMQGTDPFVRALLRILVNNLRANAELAQRG